MNDDLKFIIKKDKITPQMLSKFKVSELKEVLIFFSLRTMGKKEVIIDRIVHFCNTKKVIKNIILNRKPRQLDPKFKMVENVVVGYDNAPLSIEHIHFCIENNLKYACPLFLSQSLNPEQEEHSKIQRILQS